MGFEYFPQVVVNFTPTGMVPTKAQTPHVPISVSEIIADVHQAYELGISLVHLHARDAHTGVPTYEAQVYADIIAGIRRFAPDLVVCVSLSGRNFPEFEKRADPLELDGNLKPDMGSLTLSSLNFAEKASLNEPEMIKALAQRMKERGILPELEVFDFGMMNFGHYLAEKSFIKAPFYYNLIVGNIAGVQADLAQIGTLLHQLPPQSVWALGGIGKYQLEAAAIAIAKGGGVRIGIEDNIWFDRSKTRLATNLALLQRVHDLAQLHERAIMPPAILRKLLHLKEGFGQYGLV